MVMKQRDKIETLEADLEVAFSDKEGHSVLTKNEGNRFAGKPQCKSGFSLLLGAVILGLFVLVAVLFQHPSNVDSESNMKSLERRIKRLEGKLHSVDKIEADLEHIKENYKQLNTLIETARALDTPSKSTAARTVTNKPEAVYHKVVAGETLYRISRRYGLAADELRRLNQLRPEAIIFPGQRLLVCPGNKQ